MDKSFFEEDDEPTFYKIISQPFMKTHIKNITRNIPEHCQFKQT